MDSLEKLRKDMRDHIEWCAMHHINYQVMEDWERRLAALQQEPVATLHDDGYFVFTKSAPQELKHKATYAGWKMQVYAAPPVPDGMVLVPIEPTEAMIIAGNDVSVLPVDEIYKAMLAAAKEE